MHALKSLETSCAMLAAIAVTGCGTSSNGDSPGRQSRQPLALDPTADATYAYFRSNETGWNADSASLMQEVAPNVWKKKFNVTQTYEVNDAMPAVITLTNQSGGWGTMNATLIDATHVNFGMPYLPPGTNSGLLEGQGQFWIRFPALGQYEVTFYADGPAYSVVSSSQSPAQLSPPSGSVLKAKVQTFSWGSGADEYWLRIGKSPGASDVYASSSLGTATSHTVSNLPLNGAQLYLQLRYRTGTVINTASATYTASLRRALTVVADFSNARLEDYDASLPGVHSMAEVRSLLDEMTDHWNWVSRDVERVQWDLTRVRLPEALGPHAFSSAIALREAIVREVVRAADARALGADLTNYDVDGDGIYASLHFIAAGQQYVNDPDWAAERGYNNDEFTYLDCCATRTGLFSNFLNAQASRMVRQREYGALNHEFGHNSGLPDIYGDFANVDGLTFMSSAGLRLPGEDVTPYEREILGFFKPTLLSQSRSGVVLPPASQQLAAVKIPTRRAYEYFLIEYRKTPSEGYGSAGQRYDGLAVYHVFTPSLQRLNPPLLKLEPADGTTTPNSEPAPSDFFFPENAQMDLSRSMRSYVTDQPVFRLGNVRRVGSNMVFDIQILGDGGPITTPNLVQNASFESGSGQLPSSWTAEDPNRSQWTTQTAHSGSRSVSIASVDPIDLDWRQQITGLAPAQTYLLCGWVKGNNVTRHEGLEDAAGLTAFFGDGGNEHLRVGYGTFDWREGCIAFRTDGTFTNADIACRLGGFGATASGKMWCDDLSLRAPKPAF